MHATYLINRLPTPILKGMTPYEVLFNKPLPYNHLKVFGSLCFASTSAHSRHKMTPRSRKCVFIGYPANVKGFLLFDLDTKATSISRDISFHEEVFPFKENATSELQNSSYAPPLPVLPELCAGRTNNIPVIESKVPNIHDTSIDVTDAIKVHQSNPSQSFYPRGLVVDLGIQPGVAQTLVQTDQPRRSNRHKTMPIKYHDCYCGLSESQIDMKSPHSLHNFISYNGLTAAQ